MQLPGAFWILIATTLTTVLIELFSQQPLAHYWWAPIVVTLAGAVLKIIAIMQEQQKLPRSDRREYHANRSILARIWWG